MKSLRTLTAVKAERLISCSASDDRFVQSNPRHQRKCFEATSQVLPISSLGVELTHCLGKQRAAQLLHLVHQERQKHQHREDRRKILLAVTKVVVQVVTLVLQRIERFILDLPTAAPTRDQLRYDRRFEF